MEYSGYLSGGPNHGEFVTTVHSKFPAEATTFLWLDGKGEDKIANEVRLKGHYIWNEKVGQFDWNMEDAAFFTRKPIKESS